MTKGGRLIWDLFMWLREVMPATPENTRRQQEWAARFHQMEEPEPTPPPAYLTEDQEPPDADDEPEPPDEPDEDPHEHGIPNRGGAGSGRRKKK